MADKNWIEKATKKKGVFKKKAKAAGESTAEYADDVLKKDSKAPPKTKKQAALAETLGKLRRKMTK